MTSFANNSRSQLSDANTISDHHKAQADINYRLNFERFSEHLVDVSLNFTAVNDVPQLWLPAWIPGSYLMREFARNITAVWVLSGVRQPNMDDDTHETYRAHKIR